MAPVAPSGCPIAIAPPLTLILLWSMFISFINNSTTEAKASLSSHKSISAATSPAFLSALRAEGAGPVSIMRSEEHTSELQSRPHLVCRLLLEKKKVLRILHEHAYAHPYLAHSDLYR